MLYRGGFSHLRLQWSGRLSLSEYMLAEGILGVMWVCALVLGFVVVSFVDASIGAGLLVACCLVLVALDVSCMARRLHDTGRSGLRIFAVAAMPAIAASVFWFALSRIAWVGRWMSGAVEMIGSQAVFCIAAIVLTWVGLWWANLMVVALRDKGDNGLNAYGKAPPMSGV